jgi:hypothetical protein
MAYFSAKLKYHARKNCRLNTDTHPATQAALLFIELRLKQTNHRRTVDRDERPPQWLIAQVVGIAFTALKAVRLTA